MNLRKLTMSMGAFGLCLAALAATATIQRLHAAPPPPKGSLDQPTLSCGDPEQESLTLFFTAGASGAPAGFSVQWMTKEANDLYGWNEYVNGFDADGNPIQVPTGYCQASFSGNSSNGGAWQVGSNESVEIPIGGLQALVDNSDVTGVSTNCGGPLVCGTEYVFRAFAHNVPGPAGLGRSPFSENAYCSTKSCVVEPCCMYSHGRFAQKFCAQGVDLGTVDVGCAVLDVCTELGNNYGGPDVADARGRLGHQIIAVSLSLKMCDGGDFSVAQELLDNAIAEYCNPLATKNSLGIQNSILDAHIKANHCPD